MLSIKEIIEKKPYNLIVRFSNDEVRIIDFNNLIAKFPQLKNTNTFLQVELDDYPTLSWKDQAKMLDYDGQLIDAPLDFCPDMLWEISKK